MNIKTLRDYFIKDMGQGWGKSSGAQQGFRFLLEAASFVKGGVVLDAGAGQQRLKPFFEKSIYITQEHQQGIHLKGMDKIEYDLINSLDEKIPLKDSCLDEILSNSVLEHLRYPQNFFAEGFRVLKPGGKIYISVPFFYFEHEVPYDFNRPTRFGIERWLEDAGFVNIKVIPGSTCVSSITSFLPLAIVYDLLQTNKHPKKVFLNLLHSKNGYIKLIKKLHLFFLAGVGYFLMKLLVNLLDLLINVEPYQDANMPSGWLATASKPGKYIKKSYKNKQVFLNKNKLVFTTES